MYTKPDIIEILGPSAERTLPR